MNSLDEAKPKKTLADLRGKNIVVYDCEIKRTIDGKIITWSDHAMMGISVACLYDYRDGDTKVYLEDNISELADRLFSADLVVGFNTMSFDNKLVGATIRLPKEGENSADQYDLLVELRKGKGLNMYAKGCKLDNVLEATFGIKKTEDGAMGPIFYQENLMGKLVSYCLADVRRERMAFEYAYLNGFLKTATHGIHPMRCPLQVMEVNKMGDTNVV